MLLPDNNLLTLTVAAFNFRFVPSESCLKNRNECKRSNCEVGGGFCVHKDLHGKITQPLRTLHY